MNLQLIMNFSVFIEAKKRAEYILRKIKKHRYPHMNEDEINDYESKNGETIKISYVDETNSKTYSI